MFMASDNRYDSMIYRRCGKSGLKLSAVSLGLWKNFSASDDFSNMEKMIHTAFDLGIIYFDLANNYGDPYIGSAEENFGRILDNGM
ncbi:MAG: aldo/keto reductase, partial [Oscillospiraceae bacterium]|nr:aldo/keto reductase [Oscillospiraceae bacterium]